jgi:anti-sigma regulatory factor (Ser/Thr protein kinase)
MALRRAVAGRGAAVAPGVPAVLGRIGSIVRGRSPRGTGYLGLIGLERVADRGANVALPGRTVAALGRAVSGVGVPIGLIAVIGGGHGRERSDRRVGPSETPGNARRSRRPPRGQNSGMPSASWTAPASAESVAELRQAVTDFAYEHGVQEPRLTDIRLAVSEAITNAIVHAFRGREGGTVIVSVTTPDAEWVEVRVTDNGSGMVPRDDSPGIGLGLPLIRHLADQFDHGRPPGSVGTELRMRFRRVPSRCA